MTAENTNVDYAKTAEQAKGEGFYSSNAPAVDFVDWARLSVWEAEHGVSLSFGLEPHYIDWKKLGDRSTESDLARKMMHALMRLRTAQQSGDIALPTRPYIFVDWVKARGLDVPGDLIEAVNRFGRPVPDWEMLYRECQTKLSALEKQQTSNAPSSEKSIGTQERRTYRRMILGMAIAGYGYEPQRERNEVTGDIAQDLDDLDLKVTRSVIAEKLREAIDDLDFAIPETWTAKRNR